MDGITVEIRAGEGGADARLFVSELAGAYLRLAARRGWECAAQGGGVPSEGAQTLFLTMVGKGVFGMENESGGHRLQRVPETERNGRVHSSNVTVAVFRKGVERQGGPESRRQDSDFEVCWYSGQGAGGQNRNKKQCSARLVHKPTGLVRTAQTRSRENSLRLAMEEMTRELDSLSQKGASADENMKRRVQVGAGERSDRRRVWAFQRDSVDDFQTGKRVGCKDAMRGMVDSLWPGEAA